MINTSLKVAFIVLTLAPGAAPAQSALTNLAVPGSGYQIQQVPRTTAQSPSAIPAEPSKPGGGYQIMPAERNGAVPLARDGATDTGCGSRPRARTPNAEATAAARRRFAATRTPDRMPRRMTPMSQIHRPQILTDRQIDWGRKNIRSFSEAWQAAQKADEHRLKVYEQLGVEPGTVPRKTA